MALAVVSGYHIPVKLFLNAKEANVYCTEWCGSYLATVETEHEYTLIRNMMNSNDTAWIRVNHPNMNRTPPNKQNADEHNIINLQTYPCFIISKHSINITNCNHEHSLVCDSCYNAIAHSDRGVYRFILKG